MSQEEIGAGEGMENTIKESANVTSECLRMKEAFWAAGDIALEQSGIILREPMETDREEFLRLQFENAIDEDYFQRKAFREMLWSDHCSETSLFCTIMQDHHYVGYCGINRIDSEEWEIGMEILKEWQHQGIGSLVILAFTKAIHTRLGRNEFYAVVQSDNYASQGLCEKIGAVPAGTVTSRLLITLSAEGIEQFEEEHLDLIDDKLQAVAVKFGVEPRRLLSHMVKYKLSYDG